MPDTNGNQFAVSSSPIGSYSRNPNIASLNNGTSVVTWDQVQTSITGSFFQLIDANGQKIGTPTQLGTPNTADQSYPNVAILTNNNILLTWYQSPRPASYAYTYYQIFDSTGSPVTSSLSLGFGGQISQPLALPNGNAVIVTYGTTDVYAQIIDNQGNFIGSNFKVNTNTYSNYQQGYPSIVLLNNSQFLITWISIYIKADGNQDSSLTGLFGQIFNIDGSKVGTQFKINTNTDVTSPPASIASLSNGNIIAYWTTSTLRCYYQLLNNSGTKIGNEILVASNQVPYRSVIALGNGFIFLSSQPTANTGPDIYGQLYNANATTIGNSFIVNTQTSYNQEMPAASVASNGDFVVVWRTDSRDVNNNVLYSIQGQRFYGALTATNTNQTINYTEDGANVSLNSITVRSPVDTLTASLTLADPAAGRLTTTTTNGVTSTYTAATGIWQTSGAKPTVITLLNGVQYVPAANFNSNFNISLSISDDFSTAINDTISAIGTPVNDIPVLVTNSLTISQGQTLVLTSSNLSATDVDNASNTLTFTVSNVQNGRFELVSNQGIAITTFTQQQISDGQVQFVHNGGSSAPAYKVTVSDGALTTTPVAATITYNVAPVLGNNQLTINQGQTLVLTATNLSATDADNASGSLTFTVSNVQHGRFELLSNPSVAITSFTQQQITNGQVRFVHDNSTTKPTYDVSVSDSTLATTPESAAVLFNIAPVLGNNQLVINEGQTLVLTTDNLSATDADNASALLSFIVSSVTHGRFEFTSNPGIAITTFTQQQITNGQVRFVHDGSEIAPTYKVSVSDGSASTLPASAQISFTNVNDMPVLVNNQLNINPGETIILTSDNLSATDADNISSTLVFTVSNVQHGQFEVTANPGIAVTSFTQQQVVTGQVQFVHDGSDQAPAYQVSVSDGSLETAPVAASVQFEPTPVATPVTLAPNAEPAANSPHVSPMAITPNSNQPAANSPNANSPQIQVSSASTLSAGWISPATWLNTAHQAVSNLIDVAKSTSYYGGSEQTAQSNAEQTAVPSVTRMMDNLPSQLMLWKVGIHWGQQVWQWLTQASQTPSTDTALEVESNKLMQEVKQLKVTLAQAESYQSALYAKNAIVAEPYDFALETHKETLETIAQQGKANVATLTTLQEDVAYLLNVLKAEYKAQKSAVNVISPASFFTTPVNTAKQSMNVNELAIATHNNLLTNDKPHAPRLLTK